MQKKALFGLKGKKGLGQRPKISAGARSWPAYSDF